jgi:hypothetical protein
MTDVTDPVLLLRQSVCSHAFIKAPNCPKRCAHCGVDEAEWHRRQEAMAHQIFSGAWSPP